MQLDIVPFQARLERLAYNNNIQIVNFANIESINESIFNDYSRAMVIAQHFSNHLMEKYNDKLFDFHITLIKKHLLNVAYNIFHLISIEGYNALILPPLFLTENDIYTDANKIMAKLAGIGNIGKNNFFVSPAFGVKVIICSILTNAPFEFDSEYKINLCKNCNICNNNDFITSILKCPYGKDKKYKEE